MHVWRLWRYLGAWRVIPYSAQHGEDEACRMERVGQ